MENPQALKMEYEDYLRNQRGLSEKSIYHCWRFADRFLHFRFKGRRPNLSKITPADIARFMQHLISRGKPFRDKTADASQKLLPVPVQERKDQLQSGAERPAYRPETRIRVAEVSDAGAGGNGDLSR
jgi:hypothetical protein